MRRVSVMVVFAALALAACGGSSKPSSSVAAGSTATTAKASSSGSGGGNINFTGSFCTDGKAAQANPPQLTPSNTGTEFKQALDLLKKFQSEAPSEIKGDVKVIVDTYTQLVAAETTAGTDPQKLQAALAPLEAQQAALETASKNIDAYVQAHCK